MKATPFYFEIKDMLAQFVTAFDDIVINRYNAQRQPQDKLSVRYVYSPKQAVLYDIVNPNKTLTLPAVAITIGGIARDNNRVFNKIDGFYYSNGTSTNFFKPPVPVNITVNMSIITRYQNDMDQILSNFIPYNNPYVIISWKVPSEFNLSSTQEIRSEVLWDGSMTMEYPTDLNGQTKARIIADTTFTIKGWLFKDTSAASNDISNIYYIDTNYYASSLITNYFDLSGISYTYPASADLINDEDSFELSGSPYISNMFYNGNLVTGDVSLTPGVTGTVQLYGNNFNLLNGLLLSTNNTKSYTTNASITSVGGFKRQTPITGQIVNSYNIISNNIISINFPVMVQDFVFKNADFTFVLYNQAGYATTTQTYVSGDPVSINTLYYFGQDNSN